MQGSIVEIDASRICSPSIVDSNVPIVASAMNINIEEVRHVFVLRGHLSSLFRAFFPTSDFLSDDFVFCMMSLSPFLWEMSDKTAE